MRQHQVEKESLEAESSVDAEATIRATIEPHFSREYYLKTYSDVQAAGQDPLNHYLEWGAREGRRPCKEFDPNVYRMRFPSGHENSFYDAIINGRYPEESFFLKKTIIKEGQEVQMETTRTSDSLDSVKDKQEFPKVGAFGLLSPRDVALISENMDEDWYRKCYPEAERFGGSMAAYYLALGWVQGHDPSPEFSTRYYLLQNRDIAKSGINPFLHYLKHGKNEKWRRTAKVTDAAAFEAFSGLLANDLAEAIALDPMVALPQIRRTVTSPLDIGGPVRGALQQLRRDLSGYPASHVVLIPQVRLSGAARVAGIYASALAERVGAENILIVQTDGSAHEHPEWFPQGVRLYDLSQLLAPIKERDLHTRLLFDLLRGVEAKAIHLFNSRLGWDMLETLGRQLSQEVAVTAYLFTWEETADGRKVGYPIQWLRETIDFCHVIVCDSDALAQHIRDRFALPKVGPCAPVVARTPADLSDPEIFQIRLKTRAERMRSGKVLWAGRLDRQKRPDILEAVARRMPETTFEVYGRAVLDKAPENLGSLPNVTLMGEYQDFAEVVSRDYDAFLYTAQWDGLPTILLDVVNHGLPIVASAVGGIGELIGDGTGWPIYDIEDIDAYCAALAQAANDPAEAMACARSAYDHARMTYAPTPYGQVIDTVVRRVADVTASLGKTDTDRAALCKDLTLLETDR